jgi:xanthosine utilization system XapX-like protein
MLKQAVKFTAILLLLGMLAGAQTIPAGTRITIRTESQINSERAKTGQVVSGTLMRDVVAGGKTVIKAPAPVKLKVTAAKSSGRLHAPGELALRLVSVDGTPVSTSAFRAMGKSHTKSNVTKIGGGAAAGALLGGLMGGGKGALIGTAAGAGAGTGLAAATGKQEAVVHAETAITFTTIAAAKKR